MTGHCPASIALAVRSSDVMETLNREMLKVTGGPASGYALKIDGQEVSKFSREALAEGATSPRGPRRWPSRPLRSAP